MQAILASIGSLLVSFGIVLILIAGWMRLCDNGSDLAGRVLGAGVTMALMGWVVMYGAGMANRTDFRTSFPAA